MIVVMTRSIGAEMARRVIVVTDPGVIVAIGRGMVDIIRRRIRKRGRRGDQVTMNHRPMKPCRVGVVQVFRWEGGQQGEGQQAQHRTELPGARGRQQEAVVCRPRNLKVNSPATVPQVCLRLMSRDTVARAIITRSNSV